MLLGALCELKFITTMPHMFCSFLTVTLVLVSSSSLLIYPPCSTPCRRLQW